MMNSPVTHLAGVGPAKAKVLAELKIFTVLDLVHYYPLRYEDRRIRAFEAFEDGAQVSARAVVEGTAQVRWRGKRGMCTVPLRIDGRHRVLGVWFNQPYVKPKLVDGRRLVISGRFNREKLWLVISHTEFDTLSPSGVQRALTPIYRMSKGVTANQLQQLVGQALTNVSNQLEDVLPRMLLDKYRLVSHAQAVLWMHLPDAEEELRQARRRLSFEEFFLFQLQLQWFRQQRDVQRQRNPLHISDCAWPDFTAALPYPLTGAQIRACQNIQAKLSAPSPMRMLLQGDVGSGKTWVALWAIYATHCAAGQAALMAPTEILAEQHFREAERRFQSLGVKLALLTGSTAEKERRRILADLADGSVHLVIGTHALLTDDVEFSNLRLVVTDEQHRFGVAQRAVLRQKGEQTDVLFLSATPIPRTLALAVYGDLDVAVLDELPVGRLPITTHWWPMAAEQKAIRFVRKQLASGRQAFIVAPLVEESDQMVELASATELFERLQDQFAGFQVSLLHGRMTSSDKDTVMRRFISNQSQVLVSTSVIEVGIDVPGATVMLIYDADRFGLAQLHQLRGRVGRGQEQSFCLLLSDGTTDVSKQRLQTMVETNDGFVIAEKDLSLRGPGEFLGVRQSGLPEFTVGDLSRDLRMMEVARDEAIALIQQPDFWLLPAYEGLRRSLTDTAQIGYSKD